MTGFARLSLTVLDCPDAASLAGFYAEVTGWVENTDERGTEPDGTVSWVQLVSPDGATLAFQRVAQHRPPVWPDGDVPQQLHLDFDVPNLDEGERQVLAIGARKADVQPGESFRVFLDPAGHPFCLVLAR